MFIASSLNEFQALFVSRLHQILSPDEPGGFILVLANSMQDEKLKAELESELKTVFIQLRKKYYDKDLQATHDDMLVFEKIADTDIAQVPLWKQERHGPWLLLNNPMRALRPPRASAESVDSIHKYFDETRFNFNKPFLRAEILWEGEYDIGNVRVLYNKFPFAPYHTIIVPDPELDMPQLLLEPYHKMIWRLVGKQQGAMPGFAVGYNSMGACASVNHLHFQGFIQQQPLPIESARWRHNNGDIEYPIGCEVYTSMQASVDRIDTFNKEEQAYNILYRPGRCYIIPRQMQGSKRVHERVQGAGWIEECGVFSISDWQMAETLTEDVLREDLRSLSI